MPKLPSFTSPVAITDLETTGFDPDVHEILEIGLVLVRQPDLTVIDEFEVKVQPERIETADPEALAVNGYTEEKWGDALPLEKAIQQYHRRVQDAIFMAHPAAFDLSFITRAFKKAGLKNPMDYHNLDLFSMAWMLLRDVEAVDRVSLRHLSEFFDLSSSHITHRALDDARATYTLLKKLVEYARD